MAVRGPRLAVLFLVASLASLFFIASAKPEITPFHNLPAHLYYFDDTTVVLYHDPVERNVYMSDDEGKSWKKVSAAEGQAVLLVEHPFDNRMAFILTEGKKHYRTSDRGKLWQSFEVDVELSPTRNPLSFHAAKSKGDMILYQGIKCKFSIPWGKECEDQTYYTLDGFVTSKLLLTSTAQCNWAHSTSQIPPSTPTNLVFCVALDHTAPGDGKHTLSASRLFSSSDFFQSQRTIVDFGLSNPKASRGVVGLGVVSKFLVAAVKDITNADSSGSRDGSGSEMNLYVSLDGSTWSHAKFPHASSSKLFENAYTIVESTTHSLAVDVLSHSKSTLGTLFVSNSNGTYFVESLKDTNRNDNGFVDFEDIVGVEGVGIANIVSNAAQVDGRKEHKKINSVITFDDGRSWMPLQAPTHDIDGKPVHCTPSTSHDSKCSLHLYSVTTPHNLGRVFSTPAPGFVMGVGSIGKHLLPYDECDTFLSDNAGLTWKMVAKGAHKYEFGDQGSVLVVVDDEDSTDFVKYSYDDGKTWETFDLGVKMRARLLTTIPDSTSQKFILLGSLSRSDASTVGARHAMVFLDFSTLGKKQCDKDTDMEKWYARTSKGKECLMGHKQWYWRRKPGANCVVGHKFDDPVEHEDNCPCDEEDYECDYNFVRQNGKCVAAGPEPIPPGVCRGEHGNEKYTGSSGYRLIPGNTCRKEGGMTLDTPMVKDCSKAQPAEGSVTHQTFGFASTVSGHWYFKDSKAILVQLADGSVWQSSNEGYSWLEPRPGQKFLVVYMHAYSNDRAYLFQKDKVILTTDTGRMWSELPLPMQPNIMAIPVLYTHPLQSDWLIFIGSKGCSPNSNECQAVAHYSMDHGRHWVPFETYVRNCGWARDNELKIDARLILCESYRDKKGSQIMFGGMNPLELWSGGDFYRNRKKLFDSVVGHAKFSEYVIVGEVGENSLDLQVSLDGQHFAKGLFPPSMQLDNHAYTVLESSTDSVFLHVTMSSQHGAEWGNLLKSNSNGTYYGLSLEYANRNERGYVDFEKMIGLDGIAVMNIVANRDQAAVSGKKDLQTRITHNDGGTWKPMVPPAVDSLGQPYKCTGVKCSLHIHGFTERIDSRATYSSPSAIGLMMAVGNVGEKLAPYADSDTFLTRDGGFTWEEIRKDAHMYEFGDSGSLLVLANDEGPTDHVLYSTDEGLSWREYAFGSKVRVRSIVTVTTETSRKFILFGATGDSKSLAIHLDFSALTHRKCALEMNDPQNDDFELWSPSEEREEQCLFGRQVLYHRRIRDRNCYVGDQVKNSQKKVKNCACGPSDFECDFNYIRNSDGACILAEGATPLPVNNEEYCILNPSADYWYERTAYREIPHSSCEGGVRLDRGAQHSCGGIRGHSALFWLSIVFLPFGITGVVGYWYYRKGGFRRGTIRLPDSSARDPFDDSGPLSTLASVPWFILGLGATLWSYVSTLSVWNHASRQGRGYRHVPVDEDAQVLRFDDDE